MTDQEHVACARYAAAQLDQILGDASNDGMDVDVQVVNVDVDGEPRRTLSVSLSRVFKVLPSEVAQATAVKKSGKKK